MTEPEVVLAAVIVDLAVWGLNKELTYIVPAELVPRVRVGSIVRVPLRNRRVRGWVVGVDRCDCAPDNTVSIAAVSGRGPVFDAQLLGMARALARAYVQPLSSFLTLFTPPRLGRRSALWPDVEVSPGGVAAERTLVRLAPGEDPTPRYAGLIEQGLAAGRGAIVSVPEVREGSAVLDKLAELFPGDCAVVHTGIDPAIRSRALWSVAEGRRKLVLGGRGALFAPAMPLQTIIVHQEHDPSFKHQQSPYYDAREAAVQRAVATGAAVVFASATPSLNAAYWSGEGWKVIEADRSKERAAWPAVEVVEPPRRGLPERAIAGLIGACREKQKTLILLPRVQATDSGYGPEEMAALVARIVPGATITRADRPGLGEPGALKEALAGDVIVATEAGLAEVGRPSIAVGIALGVDGYFRKPRGRAAEDAINALWALGGMVSGRTPRGRILLESRAPEHHAIQAMIRGDYRHFARRELEVRKAAGSPPFLRLIRLQTVPGPSVELVRRLRNLAGTTVLGPVPGGNLGAEILLKVQDVERILDSLGTIVMQASQRVLVEVDPKDW